MHRVGWVRSGSGESHRFKEQVYHTVEEAHVRRHQREDRLLEDHDPRPLEVDVDNAVHADAILIDLGMQRPVARRVAQLLGASLQDMACRRLWDDPDPDPTKQRCHDERDPRRPPPAQVRLSDEATDNGTSDRADESARRERADGVCPLHWTPQVSHQASDDGQRRGGEEATEEAAQHDCFEVWRDRDGDLEDGEDEVAREERDSAPEGFGGWAEEDWAEYETLRVIVMSMYVYL